MNIIYGIWIVMNAFKENQIIHDVIIRFENYYNLSAIVQQKYIFWINNAIGDGHCLRNSCIFFSEYRH